jgi:calcium-translocating P-type ATPase
MSENKNKTLVSINGLSTSEVGKAKSKHGTNRLSEAKKDSILDMFKEAFSDPCIIVLLAALGIKIVLVILGNFIPSMQSDNDIVEIVSIIMAIGLATGFSVLSDYRNQTRSSALQEEYGKTYAKVMRNGALENILTSEITMHDVVLLQAGDKVPVDGLIISGTVKVSQAALNGESRDETKTPADNFDLADSDDFSASCKVFMGSVVTSGEAYMVATVLGDKSELGKINQSLNEQEEDEVKDATTLKLEKLVAQIGKLGTACGVLAGVLMVICDIARGNVALEASAIVALVAEAVMLGASILIMAIPEGLALIVSLIQSMNSENMYKHNILVSHKDAFSDSAFLNILFSDKTGTITQGVLSLVEFITGSGSVVTDLKNKEFIDAITINNLAKVSEGKAIGSNNMDRALLTYALANGYDGSTREEEKIKEVSGFDSEKKCATAELTDGTILWKGATENIIDKVTHYVDENGKEKEFTATDKKAVQDKMIEQSSRAMKLLSVAKIVGKKTVLLAVLCLRDDVRTDAVQTVAELSSAGIQVVMVTGDMKETAVAIAKDAGILKNDTDVVLTHDELEALSDDELKEKLPNLRVVSRAKPLDKQRLVKIAQTLGSVAGMTGDGVNDAPALKQADCGFAMGDGTAVAQEAGDVVILNNSLTSIKDAVLNARTMMKSIGKFLIFQLTVNISTLLMNVISPVIGISEPFSIVSILWINLIMDTLCALSYGAEPVLERYMNEKPVKREADVLTPYIKSAVGVGSIFITVVSLLILKDIGGFTTMLTPADCTDPETYAKTIMFAFFIYSILFNSLNTRSEGFKLFERIKDNPRFIYIMGSVFILQTLIIQFGGKVFGTTTLTIKALLISMILGVLIIPIDMIRKLIVKSASK